MSGSQLAVITPVSGGHPSTGPIVPEGPVDPGYGVSLPPVVSHPIAPGGGPSQGPGFPTHPIAPPTYPVDPGYGIPTIPGIWPSPPAFPDHSLPIAPVLPTHPIYRPEAPNNDLPLPPGAVWPPLPPSVDGQVLCFVWVVGIGYRWTVIDPSLQPSHPIVLPPSTVPPHPDHGLPDGGRPPHVSNRPPGSVTRPDHSLPGDQPHPDQGLPPSPTVPPATPQGRR